MHFCQISPWEGLVPKRLVMDPKAWATSIFWRWIILTGMGKLNRHLQPNAHLTYISIHYFTVIINLISTVLIRNFPFLCIIADGGWKFLPLEGEMITEGS